MNQNLELQLDLAKLDLKGKRYEDAERKYLSILEHFPNNSIAWYGMGMAKYGRLLISNCTVDEVFYCFEKAKLVDPENTNQIEVFAIQNSFDVIKSLYSVYITSENINENAKQQKKSAIVTFALSSIIGTASKSSLYTNLAAIGGNVIAYSDYNSAHSAQLTSEQRQEKIITLISDIKTQILDFTSTQPPNLIEFKDNVGKIEYEIQYFNSHPEQGNLLDYKSGGAKFVSAANTPDRLKEMEQQKLLSKARGWRIWEVICYIMVLGAIGMSIDEKDPSNIPVLILWLIFGIAATNKKRKLRKQADDLNYQ